MQVSMNLLTQFVYKQVNDWICMDFMVYIYISKSVEVLTVSILKFLEVVLHL